MVLFPEASGSWGGTLSVLPLFSSRALRKNADLSTSVFFRECGAETFVNFPSFEREGKLPYNWYAAPPPSLVVVAQKRRPGGGRSVRLDAELVRKMRVTCGTVSSTEDEDEHFAASRAQVGD